MKIDYKVMDQILKEFNELIESGVEIPYATGGTGTITGNKQNNEVIINASDYKFSDFSNTVLQTESKAEWFVKLREIDAKIHSNNLVDKTNFTDDRLVMIAYKIFVESDIFDESPSLRDWWIVKRYLEIYTQDDVALINELRKAINIYIGFTFSKAVIDDEQKSELKTSLVELSKVVYEDGYIQLPQFVLDFIDGDKPVAGKKKGKEVKVPEYNFSEDEAAQWRGLLSVAEIMLEDTSEMSVEEIKNWEGAVNTAKIMLDED